MEPVTSHSDTTQVSRLPTFKTVTVSLKGSATVDGALLPATITITLPSQDLAGLELQVECGRFDVQLLTPWGDYSISVSSVTEIGS